MHTGAIAAGQLLVATEPGRGGYFDRSVVLLLEHNDDGTIGTVLTRLSPMPVSGVQDAFLEHMSPPVALFEGGPVNPDVVVALGEPATLSSPPPGWQPVTEDIGLVDLTFPPELIESSFRELRLFVGLSGWSPGQLESELIRGSWFRTKAHAEDVFGTPEGLWRRVLRRVGGAPGRWSTWTDDPTLN